MNVYFILSFNVIYASLKFVSLNQKTSFEYILLLALISNLIAIYFINLNTKPAFSNLFTRFGGIYYYMTVIRDFEFMTISFCITLHMTFTNILVQPHSKDHIPNNILTIIFSFIIHYFYYQDSNEFYQQILFGIVIVQQYFFILAASIKKTAKINRIKIDSLRKLSRNLEKIIEEIPIEIYIMNNN